MKIYLWRRHALRVAHGDFSHKIDYVTIFWEILNPKWHFAEWVDFACCWCWWCCGGASGSVCVQPAKQACFGLWSPFTWWLLWPLRAFAVKKKKNDGKLASLRRVQQYLGCLPKPLHWPATCKNVFIILGPLGPEVCHLVTWKPARRVPEKCHLRS